MMGDSLREMGAKAWKSARNFLWKISEMMMMMITVHSIFHH